MDRGGLVVAPEDGDVEGDVRLDGDHGLVGGRFPGGGFQVHDAFGAEGIALDAMGFGLAEVPDDAAFGEVGTDAQDALDELRDGRKTRPAHEVLAGHETGFHGLRSVVFPEGTGVFPHLEYIPVVVVGNLPGEIPIALAPQAVDDHVVRTGPDPALPVAALGVVFPMVGGEGGHPVRPCKLRRISQMRHDQVQPVLVQDIGLEGPEGADTLRCGTGTVGKDVVQEARLFVPHPVIDIGFEELHLVLHLLDLLPALGVEADLHQTVVYEVLLQVRVQPGHVSVGVDLVVSFRDAGQVVHAGPPPAGPVGTVLPGAVEFPPLRIGHEGREHAMEPVDVAELPVVQQFRPGKEVRARAHGIVPFEAVGSVGPDLAADETVLVLLRIEVVQGALEREEPVAVAGEKHHEGIVPHEDVAVVRHVQVRGHETGAFLGLADVPDGDLPGVPVHLHLFLMAFPEGRREDLLRLREGLRLHRLRLHGPVRILRDEDVLHIGILVGKLIGTAPKVLGQGGNGGEKQQGQCQSFHLRTSFLMVRGISTFI